MLLASLGWRRALRRSIHDRTSLLGSASLRTRRKLPWLLWLLEPLRLVLLTLRLGRSLWLGRSLRLALGLRSWRSGLPLSVLLACGLGLHRRLSRNRLLRRSLRGALRLPLWWLLGRPLLLLLRGPLGWLLLPILSVLGRGLERN